VNFKQGSDKLSYLYS